MPDHAQLRTICMTIVCTAQRLMQQQLLQLLTTVNTTSQTSDLHTPKDVVKCQYRAN